MREKAPKISVIVPVYKVETVLSRCIESILCQSFADFELILVDDGSPDASGKICDEYARQDSRIRVFHLKNGGVSAARNHGLKNAVGDYVVFIDSDDWVEPSFFLSISQWFYTYDAVFWGGEMINEEGKSIGVLQPSQLDTSSHSLSDILYSMFRIGLLGYSWSMAIRRDILTEHPIYFDERISIHEDAIFCFTCLLWVQQAVCLDIFPYKYMIYTSKMTLSRTIPADYYQIACLRLEAMRRLQERIGMPEQQRTYILNYIKYWSYTQCMERAYQQPARIAAIKKGFEEWSGIADFTIEGGGLRFLLFKYAVKYKSPYLLIGGKFLSKLLKKKE